MEINISNLIKFNIYNCGNNKYMLYCKDLNIDKEYIKANSLEEAIHNAKVFMIGYIDGIIIKYNIIRNKLDENLED